MVEDDMRGHSLVSAKQRRLAYTVESKEMSAVVEAIMVDISDKQAVFTSAIHVDHARHMFQVGYMISHDGHVTWLGGMDTIPGSPKRCPER